MLLIWHIFLYINLVFGVKAVEENKITVTLSGRKPFVILNSDGAPKGLDVLIIENFAKKLNLQIDYSVVNRSQNNISVDRDYSNVFPDQTSIR